MQYTALMEQFSFFEDIEESTVDFYLIRGAGQTERHLCTLPWDGSQHQLLIRCEEFLETSWYFLLHIIIIRYFLCPRKWGIFLSKLRKLRERGTYSVE